MFDKEDVLNALKAGNVSITFTKKDGTAREMTCTLVESLIPTDKQPKSESTRAQSTTSQPVFDLDIGEWRSFSWDSLTEVLPL